MSLICTTSVTGIKFVSNAICSLDSNTERPRVSIAVGNKNTSWLFDTGAQRTCMSTKQFRELVPPDQRRKLPQQLAMSGAGGQDLGFRGCYAIKMKIKGKEIEHPVVVLDTLKDLIMGIDLMHQHGLAYDAKSREVFFQDARPEWRHGVLATIDDICIPALSTKRVGLRATTEFGEHLKNEEIISTIQMQQDEKILFGASALCKTDSNSVVQFPVTNCAPYDVWIKRKSVIGVIDNDFDLKKPTTKIDPEFISALQEESLVISELSSADLEKNANLDVPTEYRDRYLQVLQKHRHVFSESKADLGRAENFFHKIYLRDKDPVYRKQFKIPDAHQKFLRDAVNDWLQLGVVQRSSSLYNSPVFCVPKKDGALRIVQDFRELNNKSYPDKYSMKEIHECIGDIGRAGSTIFSTLDLTSGFWQMPLDPRHRKYTAFTIPGMGQFEWVTSPMGLLGCPASFQRLMEAVLRGVENTLVYIDDVLMHSSTHEEHLKTLDETLERIAQAKMKVNLKKCFFGNKEVAYLGFRLTPEGIKPGKDKLKAIREAQPPETVQGIRSFVGLCNFFRTHIKDFAQISAPLTKLTRKGEFEGGKLPEEAEKAFFQLRKALSSDPVVHYPRKDRTYALITDASTGTETIPGGMGAILTQMDEEGKFYVIAYGSKQLAAHEKNYSPFLLEMAAACWGMETYQEHLRGKHFVLYTDHKPLEKLSHMHTKTLNRLQQLMLDYDFEIKYHKGEDLPADFLSRYVVDAIQDLEEQDIRELQDADPDLEIMKNFSQGKGWPSNLRPATQRAFQFFVDRIFNQDGLLFVRYPVGQEQKNLIYLPIGMRKKIICQHHDNKLAGHQSVDKTMQRIQETFVWPFMRRSIVDHIDRCGACQRTKKISTSAPLKQPPQCNEPNQRLHVDLFGPLKTSANGNKFILTITDAFTKYAVITAIKNKEAATVAEAIFTEWVCRLGIPKEILSDQGKEFINATLKELCSLLEIVQICTSPYHPQTNAQAEVLNKTVAGYLKKFVNETTLDWEMYVPALNFAYNTSYHRTIATSPFRLMYGIKPRMPGALLDKEFKTYSETDSADRFRILQKARQIALERSLNAKDEQRFFHDKKCDPNLLRIGQKVLLRQETFVNMNRKLSKTFDGPYTILEKKENNIRIRAENGKSKFVNVDRVIPFIDPGDFFLKGEGVHKYFSSRNAPDSNSGNQGSPQQGVMTRSRTRKALISVVDAKMLINECLISRPQASDYWYLMSIWSKIQFRKPLTSEEKTTWTKYPVTEIARLLTGDPHQLPDLLEYAPGTPTWVTTSTSTRPSASSDPTTSPPTTPVLDSDSEGLEATGFEQVFEKDCASKESSTPSFEYLQEKDCDPAFSGEPIPEDSWHLQLSFDQSGLPPGPAKTPVSRFQTDCDDEDDFFTPPQTTFKSSQFTTRRDEFEAPPLRGLSTESSSSDDSQPGIVIRPAPAPIRRSGPSPVLPAKLKPAKGLEKQFCRLADSLQYAFSKPGVETRRSAPTWKSGSTSKSSQSSSSVTSPSAWPPARPSNR